MSLRRVLLAVVASACACACASHKTRKDLPAPIDAPYSSTHEEEEPEVVAVDAGVAPVVYRWEHGEPPPALSDLTRSETAAQTFTLRNGIKLVVVESHRRRTVGVELVFPEGAAADPPDRSGATLFAMSLLGDRFDEKTPYGTPAEPDEKSARQQVAEVGGNLYVHVSEDIASIGIAGFAVDLNSYLKRLSDVVRASRHSPDAFAAHMDGVIAALNELDVADDNVFAEHVAQVAFGDGHAYSRPVYGTPQSIRGLSLIEVSDRQEALLTPAGATLLVVGDVRPDAVFRQAQVALGDWKVQGAHRPGAPSPAPASRRKFVTVLPRQPARTTVVCTGRTLTGVKAPLASVQVLAGVLSDRLSRALREEQGLTYHADARLLRRRSAQALVACARLPAGKTEQGLGSFLAVLAAAAKVPPSAEELERVRRQLIAAYQSAMDDPVSIAAMWRAAIAMQEKPDIAQRVAELKAVSGPEVGALATKVLQPELLQWVLSGEPSKVTLAIRTHKLGKPLIPRLERIETDEPVEDDMP